MKKYYMICLLAHARISALQSSRTALTQSVVQYGPTPEHVHVPPSRAPAESVVQSDSVVCTANDAAVTVEPTAGTHEQHCLLSSVASVTAGREIEQAAASPANWLVNASRNTTALPLTSARWYVPQMVQSALVVPHAFEEAAPTVTLSPTAGSSALMSAVVKVFVAYACAVATTAPPAALTGSQPVVASPSGAGTQVRAFHCPPSTEAQLAKVASEVLHVAAVHDPSAVPSPSESLTHSGCVNRLVAVG